jgi:hypothetical protein
MKLRFAETVVRVLIARDPRRTVDAILEFLIGVNSATGAAVFSLSDGLRLFVGRGIGEEALDWTRECWERERSTLSEGRFSRSDECLLVPVMRRDHAVALLYLKAQEADMDCLSEGLPAIADAVSADSRQGVPSSPVDSYLEHAPTEEIERRKLLILLDRFEWNVARVARELKLTRTTVYRRLVEFGIPRKRVRKSVGNPRRVSHLLTTQ